MKPVASGYRWWLSFWINCWFFLFNSIDDDDDKDGWLLCCYLNFERFFHLHITCMRENVNKYILRYSASKMNKITNEWPKSCDVDDFLDQLLLRNKIKLPWRSLIVFSSLYIFFFLRYTGDFCPFLAHTHTCIK